MLSLLNDDITDEVKGKMCKKLQDPEAVSLPFSMQFTQETSLLDFVGPDSWKLFEAIGLSEEKLDWLTIEPKDWQDNQNFKLFKNIAKQIVCVNHVAE